jgi:hypothetical protein
VCGQCGGVATRVHSRYERTLADAPVAGRRVSIRLQVRRLFCPTIDCPTRTFVEQVEGLTTRPQSPPDLTWLDPTGPERAEDWQLSPKQLPEVHALELQEPMPGPDRPWSLAVSTSAPGGRRV